VWTRAARTTSLHARLRSTYVPILQPRTRSGTGRAQVGNLSFFTTEEQIHELFGKCANIEEGGGVKRIIMGLDRNTRCVPPSTLSSSEPK
jgi:hypothetical protein